MLLPPIESALYDRARVILFFPTLVGQRVVWWCRGMLAVCEVEGEGEALLAVLEVRCFLREPA